MDFFKQERERLARDLPLKLEHYLAASRKSETGDDDWLAEFDLDKWVNIVPDAQQSLRNIAAAGGAKALVDVVVEPDDDMFGAVAEDAADFAAARAAEMVGKKFVDGELVDNPDAKWAITNTTREELNELITGAIESGMTPPQLAREIEASTTFSQARAEMIAATEMANALVSGTIFGWKQSGVVVGKKWLLSDDHDHDDVCDDNADEVVDLDDDFPSGDFAPPAHPFCMCDVVAVTEDQE